MESPKTKTISIRIPTEMWIMLREKCGADNIDLAEHVRRLIDRDLSAMDSIPMSEKKFIERVLERELAEQTRGIVAYFDRNFGDKIDKIYYNMGTNYDKATVKSRAICAYIVAQYVKICRPCPDDMDDVLMRYRNEYCKIDPSQWDKADQTFKNEVDNEVKRSAFLYKMMDYAANRCKKKETANIFFDSTIQDFRQMMDAISKEKDINYTEVERKMNAQIDRIVEDYDTEAFTACAKLKRYAGIENSEIEAEIAKGKAWLQQLKQSTNILETAQEICETIKPKSIINKFMKPPFEKKEVKT